MRALDRPTELTLERGEKCNLLCDEDRELWLVSRRAKSNAVDSVGYVPPVSYDISESAICHAFDAFNRRQIAGATIVQRYHNVDRQNACF